ncbi:MAG: polysaccharide biosynthesis protein [Firmicutes bacterium]|nr:polysaccharide biosynthesis protein [Bacillota bacterium]
MLALVIVTVIYVAASISAISVVPHAELAASEAPLVEVVRRAAPWFPSILFTGIRPGEKLVEQLVGEGEGIIPTRHERIFAVSECREDFTHLEDLLRNLESENFSFQESEIVALLQKVLPNFKK